MSAPNPVPWNPAFYKVAYQTKQSQAGIPGGADVNAGQHSVLDCLAFPSALAVAAGLVNVAEEQADNTANPEAGVSGPNDPTAFE